MDTILLSRRTCPKCGKEFLIENDVPRKPDGGLKKPSEAPESGFSYPVAPNPTLTGKVSLKAVIGTDGTVTEVDVLSGNHALADAAVRAVRHWRYRPHELKGHAFEAETRIVISFVSADAVSISFPAAH